MYEKRNASFWGRHRHSSSHSDNCRRLQCSHKNGPVNSQAWLKSFYFTAEIFATDIFRNIERAIAFSCIFADDITSSSPRVTQMAFVKWNRSKKCYEFRTGLRKKRRGCPGQHISFLRGSFPNSLEETKHIPRELQRNRNAKPCSRHTDATLYRNNLTRVEQIMKWNE